MNNIFQKNISALALKNPVLAEQLSNYLPNDVPELLNQNGAYNLKYKELFIHNVQNPLGEAKEIFSMATNEPVAIHIIYGLGLGYLFQVACLNSLGTVILYEPDLNIMKSAFMLVDFSNDILKNNVFITNTLEDVSNEVYKKSNTANTPQLLSLPSARELNQEEFEIFVKKMQEIIGGYTLDLKFTKETFYPSLKMLIQNMPELMHEIPLTKFKDIYYGKTAVVVSAGPTLDKNIETLKEYRDKYILFTVGTAVKTLYNNGIKPDFLCIIETYNATRQVENLDLSDVYFITEPYSNPELRKFNYKKILSHISANSPINHFLADICGEDIEEYWSKGTVSYTALNCARILGCKKIILVGQDLAYIEGQCYSKDSSYKDLVCLFNKEKQKWEIAAKDFDSFAKAISASDDESVRKDVAQRRLHRLNNSLYYVKGIRGDMIPTESVYAAFVRPLTEFAEHFKGIEYINTSLIGAQIDGFKNISLEEALSDSEPISLTDLTTDFSYNVSEIQKNINDCISAMSECLKYTEDGKQVIKNLSNNLRRKKSVDEEILKLLKKVSLIYLNLIGEFSDKNKLYSIISAAEKISDYLNKTESKIYEIENMLKGVINEGFDTKS